MATPVPAQYHPSPLMPPMIANIIAITAEVIFNFIYFDSLYPLYYRPNPNVKFSDKSYPIISAFSKDV